MGYYYGGIDITYIILVLPAVIFATIMQIRVSSTFNRFSQVFTMRRLTGAQVAAQMLQAYGISDVRIERTSGSLTDHFDPQAKVIRLSDSVYDVTSVAAAGVAAHECGHAMQYAMGYGPVSLRNAIIPVSRFGSMLAIPLILLGFFFSFQPLVTAGIVFFAAAVFFQVVTLPVEFNASNRAIETLERSNLLSREEIPMARKVLWAAAMTYVAALAVSLAQLLRLVLIFGNRDRD